MPNHDPFLNHNRESCNMRKCNISTHPWFAETFTANIQSGTCQTDMQKDRFISVWTNVCLKVWLTMNKRNEGNERFDESLSDSVVNESRFFLFYLLGAETRMNWLSVLIHGFIRSFISASEKSIPAPHKQTFCILAPHWCLCKYAVAARVHT